MPLGRLTHRSAVAWMVLVTLLWSMAGIVSRWLESATPFEMTFWRSAFNGGALFAILLFLRGAALPGAILRAPPAVWGSGLCWSVMFTAFMVAITLTTVANVLVIMALGPLLTALLARLWLGHRLAAVTWCAILLAGAGIAGMFFHEAAADGPLTGSLVALAVPFAAAVNWTLLQRAHAGTAASTQGDDMLLAVLIGAAISALLTLPLAFPFQASLKDVAWLAFLGSFQLAVPCLIIVRITRVLPGPQVALLGTLEVLFGVAWAWLGAGEQPGLATIIGGGLVLLALVANEVLVRPAGEAPVPLS